jgi:hypothetical protein
LKIDSIDPTSRFCFSVILGSYKRLAPLGRLLPTSEARAERDVLLLAWAMSTDMHEIALGAIGQHPGVRQDKTLEEAVHFGQITGSLEARESIFQQHLTTDPSLFVVNELVPSSKSLMRQRVVAWTLKLARDEITKSIQSDQAYSKNTLVERLTVHKRALAVPALRGAITSRIGRSEPREATINYARRGKSGLHPKAAECLCIYQGLRRLAPFALRHVFSDTLFDHLGGQQLLELAGGLAMAEALSVASGYPLAWNASIASDGIMANVGPLKVGWHKPIDFHTDGTQSMVSVIHTQTDSCISFIQCAEAPVPAVENEVIRQATESLVTACRKESKKGPRFEETPLADCAVVIRRLYNYEPEAPTSGRLTITEFEGIARGRFLELARRVCSRANLI